MTFLWLIFNLLPLLWYYHEARLGLFLTTAAVHNDSKFFFSYITLFLFLYWQLSLFLTSLKGIWYFSNQSNTLFKFVGLYNSFSWFCICNHLETFLICFSVSDKDSEKYWTLEYSAVDIYLPMAIFFSLELRLFSILISLQSFLGAFFEYIVKWYSFWFDWR